MPSSYSNIRSFSLSEASPGVPGLVTRLLRSRLTSASTQLHHYNQFPALVFAHTSTRFTRRSPRVRIFAFRSSNRCIYVIIFRTVSGFCLCCNIALIIPPYMQFLFVGPNFCRQLLSDSQSPATPLLLANTSYRKGVFGTFTL